MEKTGIERVERFLAWNRAKVIIFLLFVIIGIGFQSWAYIEKNKTGCLEIFCGPTAIEVVYGAFLPFDYLNVWILKNVSPERWLLIIDNIIIWSLQAAYWYLLSCLISIGARRMFLNIKNNLYNKRNEKERLFRESIEKSVKHAE